MKHSIKFILLAIFCLSLFGCNSDDDDNSTIENVANTNNVLIGEWLRNDFDEDTEYRLTFSPDNTVLKTLQVTTTEGITSSAQIYNWTIENDLITIENFENNENATTSYELISNEVVILNELSEFEFLRQ